MKIKNKISVNGKHYNNIRSLIISNNEVYVDDEKITEPNHKTLLRIHVDGDINNLKVDNCNELSVIGDCGNVNSTSGNINIVGNAHNVKTTSGNVNAKIIKGNVKSTSGSIKL